MQRSNLSLVYFPAQELGLDLLQGWTLSWHIRWPDAVHRAAWRLGISKIADKAIIVLYGYSQQELNPFCHKINYQM